MKENFQKGFDHTLKLKGRIPVEGKNIDKKVVLQVIFFESDNHNSVFQCLSGKFKMPQKHRITETKALTQKPV